MCLWLLVKGVDVEKWSGKPLGSAPASLARERA